MVRHDGSGCPQPAHAGGITRRTRDQQSRHTGPSSGRSSTPSHAAHCGPSAAAISALRTGKSSRSGGAVGEFVPGGVAPEPLEAIEGAALTAEDVYDEVEVVEEDPLG